MTGGQVCKAVSRSTPKSPEFERGGFLGVKNLQAYKLPRDAPDAPTSSPSLKAERSACAPLARAFVCSVGGGAGRCAGPFSP
jgi:hypothetical protein